MLRMHAEIGPEIISRMHHSQHAIRSYPLHRVGQAFVQVSFFAHSVLEKIFQFQLSTHFSQLFGEHNEDEDVSPDAADPEAVASAGDAALTGESTESGNVQRVSTRKWAEEANYDAAKIFNKLFCDDIKYLLSMSDLWKKRTPPTPLRYGEFDDDVSSVAKSTDELQLNGNLRDQKVWNLRECQSVFATSLNELQQEFRKLAEDDNLVWDKDDKAAMDFVAACANVRAMIFNIPQKSRFEIKCKRNFNADVLTPPTTNLTAIFSYFQPWRAISFRPLQPPMRSLQESL